ncbi:transcription termination factor Rho [Pseudokineococcus sp. 5B2Z-1]|uniref:transcription termination factor Rho n=1 Tax=Pseudokineococcus sp. 5B2Z-1 TaxID=3132744 RepID=UPI0030A6FB64
MTDTTDIAQPEAQGDAAPARRAPLSQLRLGQLQELASSLGVQGTATMRKSDLLAAIRAEQGPSTRGRRAAAPADADADAPSRPEQSRPEQAQPPQPRRGDDDAPAQAPAADRAAAPAQTTAPDEAPTGRRGSRPRRAERPAGAPDTRTTPAQDGAAERVSQDRAPQDRGGDAAGERPAPEGREAADGGREARAPRRDQDGRERDQQGQQQSRDQQGQQQGRDQQGRDQQTGAAQGGDRRLDARAQLEQSLDLRERARHRRGDEAEDERGDRARGRDDRQDRGRDDRSERGERQDRGDRPDRGAGQGQQDRQDRSGGQDDDDELGGRRGRRGRYRDRKRRGRGEGAPGGGPTPDAEPEVSEGDVLVPVAGVLDVLDSYAFVRTSGYLPGPNDVYVTLAQVKKHGMRKGDVITGGARAKGDGDGDGQDAPSGSGRSGRQQRQQRAQKFNPLVRVDTVNGLQPDEARRRPDFTKLTPLYPQDRLRLETERGHYTQRVIDLVAPIGKGQRGLIVAPPKAGKTIVMQQIANAITRNNPDVHLMVVLVDERPEEVTDMQRTVKGEVIASTFDRPADDHTTVAELAIERAKRLVELGHDVVVLLDSLTRLSRAYNTSAPASGRILSGGIDASALYPPKRFFGAARNIEHGGSLTILASALVETGSKADEVIFEEFKGTGNMELRLARHLADKRIFPAVDVNASGTRREEILMSAEELKVVYKLRRVLGALDSTQAIELVLGKLRETGSNAEFLMQVQRTAPSGPGGDQRSELSPS